MVLGAPPDLGWNPDLTHVKQALGTSSYLSSPRVDQKNQGRFLIKGSNELRASRAKVQSLRVEFKIQKLIFKMSEGAGEIV